jgi:tetratricopeptide (TPR) repeat protein
VLDKATVALVDLVELPSLGEHKQLSEVLTSVLLEDYRPHSSPPNTKDLYFRTHKLLDSFSAQQTKSKWEKTAPKEDLQLKQAAALVVKLEGNARFSSGDISGAAAKYTEALALCPVKAKKERLVLYSNRAQCHLLLRNPEGAISDATRALCLHNPVNRHGRSLWRRAQVHFCQGSLQVAEHKSSMLV